jgi:ribosomal-protein-alanine N-acetyltransferase
MSHRRRIHISPLTPDDVAAASAIEALSMARPWPVAELMRDLTHNPASSYLGAFAEDLDQTPPHVPPDGLLVGFVGGWRHVDEIHVTTVAVHPDWRRQGIGRSLMLHLMTSALDDGMVYVTLEVRVSNAPARQLYRQLGFREAGSRRGYYADNGEDALILTTPSGFDREWRAGLERLLAAAYPFVGR